mmetsp:Transcript_38658/g.89822  ORF Transcript_38658/g.89822 Transcript_38658/m.89822 type:complete len:90 (-) Transcript_38658:481-750(-)
MAINAKCVSCRHRLQNYRESSEGEEQSRAPGHWQNGGVQITRSRHFLTIECFCNWKSISHDVGDSLIASSHACQIAIFFLKIFLKKRDI